MARLPSAPYTNVLQQHDVVVKKLSQVEVFHVEALLVGRWKILLYYVPYSTVEEVIPKNLYLLYTVRYCMKEIQ